MEKVRKVYSVNEHQGAFPNFWLTFYCEGLYNSWFKKKLFIFRQRGREGGREGEKYQCVIASHEPLTGDLACNPDKCLDWELNQQPTGLQVSTESTKPYQPGHITLVLNLSLSLPIHSLIIRCNNNSSALK